MTYSSALGYKHITQLCLPNIIQDKEWVPVLWCPFKLHVVHITSLEIINFAFFFPSSMSVGDSGFSWQQSTLQHFQLFHLGFFEGWGWCKSPAFPPGHSPLRDPWESYLLKGPWSGCWSTRLVCLHQLMHKRKYWEGLFQSGEVSLKSYLIRTFAESHAKLVVISLIFQSYLKEYCVVCIEFIPECFTNICVL